MDQNQNPIAWKAKEHNYKEVKQELMKVKLTLDSSSAKGWKVVLNEALILSSTSINTFSNHQEPKKVLRTNVLPAKSSSRNGWSLEF